jgi:hypothetical protein
MRWLTANGNTRFRNEPIFYLRAPRVERIWRREGLKVPARQPERVRLWLSDGSCIRLGAERPNHVWSYDFVEERTHDGRKLRMLNIIDEFTHECLAIRVSRRLKSIDVIDVLSDLFILRGVPGHTLTGRGGSILIVDDPLKAADGDWEVARRAADEWFSNTALSRLMTTQQASSSLRCSGSCRRPFGISP